MKCPVGCTSVSNDTDIFLPEGCLKICSNCTHLFSQCSEQVFEKSMGEFNDPQGTWPTERTTSSCVRITKKIINKIKKITGRKPSQIKLLDVGCSNGAFIYHASKEGVCSEGVEPAEKAALAAQKAGLKVYHGFIENLNLPSNSYDAITLFEVIEHLKDPLILLEECHRLLRKNGVMVIKTANTDSWTVKILKGKWHYFSIGKHGGHISFFNKRSISLLAYQAGFHVEKFNTHSVSLCEKEKVPYLVSCVVSSVC